MKLDIFCSKRNKKTFVSKIALIIAMVAIMGVTAQAEILMDYDDDEVNGVHDVAVRDGDFSNTTVAEGVDSALYSETPNWTDITEWDYQQNEEATRTNRASGVGSDRNAVLRTDPVAAQSLDYVLTAGEIDYNISYMWNDVYVWDPNCTVSVFLYTTHNDSIRGDQTDVVTCESRKSEVVLDYQTETFSGTITIPEASVGKNLFVRFESVNQTAGLARLDNLFIEVISAVELVAPANGEIEIPYDGTQLQWIVKNDWACDVNFGTDPGALALELAGYEGVGGVYAYDKDALDPNTTYYWSIDAIDPNDNLTDPSDDVRIPGPVWSFKTDHLAAIIDSDPDGLLIYPGEDAAYSVVAHNPTTGDTTGLTYQWY
ncbi:hypothetical protein KAR91_68030, partial [Candidatus Pacearchaeota archaeon]|nr:hypothetical protein [Candidatus Pacearchaeota archaeon]